MSQRKLANPTELSCTPVVVWNLNGLTLNLKIEKRTHVYTSISVN